MASIYTHQSSNVFKTYLLMALFLVFIGGIGYYFSYYYQSPAIFTFAIIFSLIMNMVSFWYSDKIALSITKARPVKREEFFDLYTLTENLSIAAGLPSPRLYVIDDSAPNAFATGRDKDHAVIAVTTGLLERLDRSELEGVIAHELSHIGNRDILLMSTVVVLVGMVAILSDILSRNMLFSGGSRRENGKGGALAIIGLVLIILSPIIATLIKLAISRRREFLADASASLLTRYPEGLAKALEKISTYSSPMRSASQATAHMFIANPFSAKSVTSLF
ncbi:MAG: M48 family metallopeptidase, partial [Patescibacteria group bacterium]